MKKLQTASKMPLDSFGTTAISHRKSIRTAGIPISTPTPTATNPWHRYITGPTKTAKADNRPTTSTVTKSASQYLTDKDCILVRATNSQSINCFDYNGNGQIIDQHHGKIRRAKCQINF